MYKKILILMVLACLNCLSFTTQAQVNTPGTQPNYQVMKIFHVKIAENYIIVLKKIPYQLQKEPSQVDIAVNIFYRHKRGQIQYIDSKDLVNNVNAYLKHQQGKNNYWEKINRNLAIYLLKKYSQLLAVRSTFLIHANKSHPFAQQSVVFIRR